MIDEIWKPYPKQERALTIYPTDAFEILFGGARGPGKTDAGIIWLLGTPIDEENHIYIDHPRYRALILRRDYNDLSDWIDRAQYLYRRYGALMVGNPAVIRWPSGAKFRLGHLKDKRSYEKYLGHEYQRVLIEELTQIGEEKHYINILGSVRSTIDALKPQIFNTTNPPGIGHLWVKNRFVDPAPFNTIFEGEDTRKRIYIPGTIDDNPALVKKDPGYILFLEGLKLSDPELYEAWRHGDWNVMAGQYFKTFRYNIHAVDPFEPRSDIPKFGGLDWGRAKPFCFLAAALEKVQYEMPDGDTDFFNRVWVYKELYDIEKDPFYWANKIKEIVKLNEFLSLRADPSIFHKKEDGSRSIANQFKDCDVILVPANNDRIGGWEAVKNWLSIAPDGLPYLMISKMCNNLIRTIPAQVHDETNAEDLDTEGEDHAVDALRYMLIHIKWIDAGIGTARRKFVRPTAPKHVHIVDLGKFVK
jgi:hypothetical protein